MTGNDTPRTGNDTSNGSRAGAPGSRIATAWKIAGAVIGIAALMLLARQGTGLLTRALEAIRDLGPWAALAYITVYAVATVAWIPGSILTVASGAVFGLVRGTAYTLVGATLGATLAFLVARHLVRGSLKRRLESDARWSSIDEAIGEEGSKLVFLLRLSPVFPFNLLNYALGLTAVRVRDYVLASAVGMAPGTFMYVYAGFAAGEIAMGAVGEAQRGLTGYILLGLGLTATVAVTVFVTRVARRALREASDMEGRRDEKR